MNYNYRSNFLPSTEREKKKKHYESENNIEILDWSVNMSKRIYLIWEMVGKPFRLITYQDVSLYKTDTK